MKRKKNLYDSIYNFENILNVFNEVCRNTKSKRKVANLKEYKATYESRVYNILKDRAYVPRSC